MRNRSKALFIFLLCSFFLHLLSWVSLNFSSSPLKINNPEQVEIEIRPPGEANAPDQKRQIVEQSKQLNTDVDESAKYLSAFNQKAQKQTRAQQSGRFHNATSQGAPKVAKSSSATTEKTKSNQALKDLSLSSLTPKFEPQAKNEEAVGDQGTGADSSATDDYLKEELGMQTMLSTREFVYYSYYNRIKEKIRQHWEPTVREKVKMVYRQGRSIASTKDHVTQVVIVLNRLGELLKVEVVTHSGVEDLDAAAVEAFQSAQPFPNPPKGLVEKDEKIRIRWDFVLEARNQGSPTIRRRVANQGGQHESNSTGRL